MDIKDFDPNGTGLDNGNYFGMPFSPEESELVLLSVPWDVTASYGGGARFAPDAIIGASVQLDLYDPLYPGGWQRGIGTAGIDYSIQDKSTFLRDDALKVMQHLVSGGKIRDEITRRKTERINEASEELNAKVYEESKKWLAAGKTVGLVGGDHSTPFGLIRAVAERAGRLSILCFDAHADMRIQYEGFTHSHASIMYNIAEGIAQVDKIVQVGVRDLCDAEVEYAAVNPKVEMFRDDSLAANRFRGVSWDEQCDGIVDKLGETVYISFDIDGLSPDNCPHTGTPVPGGLSFNEAVYLMSKVASSGRRIAGFDLCEVAPSANDEWDANVGARILYKLCNLTLKTSK